MGRLLKSIKPYFAMVIAIIGLLFVEVYCELALPDYTSNIIDTGIQNSGVEHILPEKITKKEFDDAKIFMNDKEKEAWDAAYKKDGDIFDISYTNQDKLASLDKELAMPLILNSQFSNVDEDMLNKILADSKTNMTASTLGIKGFPTDIRPIFAKMLSSGQMSAADLEKAKEQMKEKLDAAGGDSLQKSMGIAYAKKMDELAGIDMNAKQQSYLWSTGAKMAILAGILAVALILISFFASKVGAGVGRDLRRETYGKVMSFSNGEIEKFSTASLVTRTTNDVQNIQMTTTISLRLLLYAPIMSIAGIIKVAQTGAGLGWVIALAVGLIFAIMFFLFAVAVPKFKLIQSLVDNINRVSREILTGLPVIRAFGTEKREEARFNKANKDLFKVQVFVNRTMSVMMPALMFIMFGLTALIVLVSAGRIDEGLMQVGQMTAFITYSMLIVMSFLLLTMVAILLPRSLVACNRIDEVIKTESSIKNKENALKIDRTKATGRIEFKDVSFKYPEAEGEVLKDINFIAEAGKTTAIIGATGCGKSTLIQLIPRLYDVSQGSITFDGVDVRDLDLKDLREEIGYVPQKALLFSGDIASNIKYGAEDLEDEMMEHIAEVAQASEFISRKEDTYSSKISEGGNNVSGGQKQRLSIARALAKKPKLLIFDDSFSALDLKTDRALRKALKEENTKETTIIVAQRVSTIMDAEKILVMEEGKIVGQGIHEELLKNCQTYREIAESQMTRKELYGEEGKEG